MKFTASWVTQWCGIIGAAAATTATVNLGPSVTKWATAIAAIITSIGVAAARQNNVTSEQVGAATPPKK